MIVEKYNGNKLEIYDSIEDMPITRYQAYNKAVLIDSGIGSSFDDINNLIGKALRYNEEGDKVNVQNLLISMVNCYTFIIENTSPELTSFVCLLKSINGEPVDDLSEENVKQIIDRLGKQGLTMRMVSKILDKVKKKLRKSLKSSSQTKQPEPTL